MSDVTVEGIPFLPCVLEFQTSAWRLVIMT